MNGITLRVFGKAGADDAALRRVSERDCANVPEGPVLGAEIDGELIAAISIASRRVVADPFRPTADAVDLLRRRADQIRDQTRPAGRRLGLRLRAGRSSLHRPDDDGAPRGPVVNLS